MITELYCQVDDFCIEHTEQIKSQLIESGQKRQREGKLSLSEIMTILITFQQQSYRQFKAYYEFYVKVVFKKEFPTLPSYNRFIELLPRAIYPMLCFLNQLLGKHQGVGFIDSTKLSVCDNRRIHSHKVQSISRIGYSGISKKSSSKFKSDNANQKICSFGLVKFFLESGVKNFSS